jgi:hypothetical protein
MAPGRQACRGAALIPKVALDLDNVIVDIVESARMAVAVLAGVEPGDLVDTGLYASPFTHPDPEVARLIVTDHDFWQREDVLAGARPLPGARNAVWRLHDAGGLAGYVTRRSIRARGITAAWLDLHDFPAAQMRFVGHHEQHQNHAACKAEECIDLQATHLIDDSQAEAGRAMERGIVAILVDHPLGRIARSHWLADHPGVRLAPDIASAISIIMDAEAGR